MTWFSFSHSTRMKAQECMAFVHKYEFYLQYRDTADYFQVGKVIEIYLNVFSVPRTEIKSHSTYRQNSTLGVITYEYILDQLLPF